MQRNFEISVIVIDMKVEKISLDGIWLNPKYYIIGNQQESRE